MVLLINNALEGKHGRLFPTAEDIFKEAKQLGMKYVMLTNLGYSFAVQNGGEYRSLKHWKQPESAGFLKFCTDWK